MTATATPDTMLRTSEDASVETTPKAAAAKRPRSLYVLGALLTAAALGVGGFYVHGIGRETTDDAQVEGRIMNVSPRISAQVARVLVQDNQTVKEGDLLVELDKGDLQAKVDSARADLAASRAQLASAQAQLALTEKNVEASVTQAKGGLAQAAASLTSSRAAIAQSNAEVEAARSRMALAQLELNRVASLRDQGAIAQAQLDSAQSTFDTAKASFEQSRAGLDSAHAGTRGGAGGVVFAEGRLLAAMTGPQQLDAQRAAVALAEARVKQSDAALKIAELNLSYTEIRAPRGGQVSRRTVEVGQQVGPEKALMAVVPLDDVWVVANLRLAQVRGPCRQHRGRLGGAVRAPAAGQRDGQLHQSRAARAGADPL